jgi:hypothetical protein
LTLKNPNWSSPSNLLNSSPCSLNKRHIFEQNFQGDHFAQRTSKENWHGLKVSILQILSSDN